MQIEPSAEKFAARYEAGEPQVVWTTLVADLETPVSAFLKIAGSRPMSFLLESVEGGAVRGRYSIIGLEPDMIFRVDSERAELHRAPASNATAFAPMDEPPLQALRTFIAESRIALPDELPPMAAGVFGYLGYDMVRLIENLPAQAPDAGDRVRCGQGHHHRGVAGTAACRLVGEGRAGARDRAPLSRGRCTRPA